MKVWDDITGDKGLKGHYELPPNLIGVHKAIVAIVIVALLSATVLVGTFIRHSQNESFKRFVERGNAGVYQGVTMSPTKDGCWIIAGAGDEGVRKTWTK